MFEEMIGKKLLQLIIFRDSEDAVQAYFEIPDCGFILYKTLKIAFRFAYEI